MTETIVENDFCGVSLRVAVCSILRAVTCLLFVPNNEHKLRLGLENQFSLLSARIMFDSILLV